jgi:hypothetical protein
MHAVGQSQSISLLLIALLQKQSDPVAQPSYRAHSVVAACSEYDEVDAE